MSALMRGSSGAG